MPIYHTTQIRARTFEPGKLPGNSVTVSYIQLSPNVLGWSSRWRGKTVGCRRS